MLACELAEPISVLINLALVVGLTSSVSALWLADSGRVVATATGRHCAPSPSRVRAMQCGQRGLLGVSFFSVALLVAMLVAAENLAGRCIP